MSRSESGRCYPEHWRRGWVWRANIHYRADGNVGKPTHYLQSSKDSTTGSNLEMMLKKRFFPGKPLLSLQRIFDT